MSDKPIAVGDLVMVVRGHECMVKHAAGVPFRVTGLSMPYGGGWTCNRCHTRDAGPNEIGAVGFAMAQIPVSWLLKIDPPALPESVEHKESLTA